jgi:hypothetical protein
VNRQILAKFWGKTDALHNTKTQLLWKKIEKMNEKGSIITKIKN